MESRIQTLLRPIAEEEGVDVLKVSLDGGARRYTLRVIVDKAGGVDVDTLERISRALGLQLDAEDLIPGRYRLEVSSPGFDWELTDAADFRRHQGEWLKVFLPDGRTIEGRNLGPCEAHGGAGFKLGGGAGDNEEQVFAMNEVVKVVRAVNWKDISRKG